MTLDAEAQAARAYYDQRWTRERGTASLDDTVRISKILWGFTVLATRFQGKVAGPSFDFGRICDLGCGMGRITAHLASLGQVIGVDYSAGGIAAARESYPHIEFVVGDATSYRSAEPFDVIVSSEVIEHVPDQRAFVGTCASNLRPGGHLILTCPNGRHRHLNRDGAISNQPLENWPTKKELLGLLSKEFNTLYYDTFWVHYHKVNRLINSHKVRSVVRAMRLASAYDAVWGELGYGLYQFVIARKP